MDVAQTLDVTQALKDAENTLRDFIAVVMMKRHGPEWISQLGVSEERVVKWRERKEIEAKRQETGTVEERLLYFADFYDLRTILKKQWADFAGALGDWKTMEVWLTELERIRDPDAHRRELLPHQKHLALGISGEIRNRIIRYRSKNETAEDYFPRLESVRDSLGSIWVPGGESALPMKFTELVLRAGDDVEFVITASDPLGEPLQYGSSTGFGNTRWQPSNTFRLRIEEENIGKNFVVTLMVMSHRKHHARNNCDDKIEFVYEVLPGR